MDDQEFTRLAEVVGKVMSPHAAVMGCTSPVPKHETLSGAESSPAGSTNVSHLKPGNGTGINRDNAVTRDCGIAPPARTLEGIAVVGKLGRPEATCTCIRVEHGGVTTHKPGCPFGPLPRVETGWIPNPAYENGWTHEIEIQPVLGAFVANPADTDRDPTPVDVRPVQDRIAELYRIYGERMIELNLAREEIDRLNGVLDKYASVCACAICIAAIVFGALGYVVGLFLR